MNDRRHMAHALALGRRGRGNVWPNPAVGCVIVQGDRVVGRGWTQPGGRPHAEAMALAQAGALARGATAYVTLEPCAHQGRGPPCSDALVAAGVARVVVALRDPDPRTDGHGYARLRAAGIEVVEDVMAVQSAEDQCGFLLRLREGRPMVTLKLATSLDGRIATSTGESQWITGLEARWRVHGLRLSHDAVLVGGGTARADDPSLTVRGYGQVRQPVRIVASAGLDLPIGNLARTARDVPVWLLHGPDAPGERRNAWAASGARLIELPLAAGGLDPGAALKALGSAGLTRVFCEGGGQLAASLLSAGLADELVAFQAGMALGGDGLPAVAAMGVRGLADASRFRLAAVERVGADTMCRWVRS